MHNTTPIDEGPQGGRGIRRPTIRVFAPNELAGKEKGRLLQGLASFANLEDSIKEYRIFAKEWPTFWPVEIIDSEDDNFLKWPDSGHKMALLFRDCLRRLWRSDPMWREDESLPLLMGTSDWFLGYTDQQVVDNLHGESSQDSQSLLHPWSAWGRPLKELLKIHPGALFFGASLRPSWKAGDFIYRPANEFQCAVYLLFKEKWRARVCALCGKYFVADKPPQLYCSTKCYGAAKRKRDLVWWKREGAKNRKARANKARKKGDK
jgi:hypothetical protein